MPNTDLLENLMQVAPLKLIVHESAKELGDEVNKILVEQRKAINKPYSNSPAYIGYEEASYLVDHSCPRFGSGEGKGVVNDSVRGKDLYILADPCNHSLTYKVNGYINHMSPDNIYQDVKRIIAALAGKPHRITVVFPFLYESRQHKKYARESLDAAIALDELVHMGVSNIVTFDAHDPKVQNSIPLSGFDNFMPPYQFVKALIQHVDDIVIDKDHLIVISPDEGALDRAVYFAGVLGVDMGMFYKRRDYSKVVNGKNPIVAHEFLGDNISGKDVIVIDDMISSGGSMIDTAKQLKGMGAKRVFICTTFGLFTDGFDDFDSAYERGDFDKVITTNLTYHDPIARTKPYYVEASMSTYLAAIIDFLNHDAPMSAVLTPTDKIHDAIKEYNNGNHNIFND
ncbi:MAG: ribose-phosphate pyrophosphokinase [Lachnospiraceae bacterium]|nr:ribose-phosphate pyrophosphokinase [Lachnospiraceae bacterium]